MLKKYAHQWRCYFTGEYVSGYLAGFTGKYRKLNLR